MSLRRQLPCHGGSRFSSVAKSTKRMSASSRTYVSIRRMAAPVGTVHRFGTKLILPANSVARSYPTQETPARYPVLTNNGDGPYRYRLTVCQPLQRTAFKPAPDTLLASAPAFRHGPSAPVTRSQAADSLPARPAPVGAAIRRPPGPTPGERRQGGRSASAAAASPTVARPSGAPGLDRGPVGTRFTRCGVPDRGPAASTPETE